MLFFEWCNTSSNSLTSIYSKWQIFFSTCIITSKLKTQAKLIKHISNSFFCSFDTLRSIEVGANKITNRWENSHKKLLSDFCLKWKVGRFVRSNRRKNISSVYFAHHFDSCAIFFFSFIQWNIHEMNFLVCKFNWNVHISKCCTHDYTCSCIRRMRISFDDVGDNKTLGAIVLRAMWRRWCWQ